MMPSTSHNDIPDDYRPWCLDRREPVQPGDPACADPNCDAHREPPADLTAEILDDPEALAQIRLAQDEVARGDVIGGADAVRELTRLGEEIGDDDLSPDEVVAASKEARRELAEEAECRAVRLVPVDEAEDEW